MRYRLSDIARMCGGELRGRDCWVGDVVTDSRRCAFGAGAMFVAMKGVNHDSHYFLGDMYQSGVRAFMVECSESIAGLEGAGYVLVDNSLDALQSLAAAHRESFKGVVVGITVWNISPSIHVTDRANESVRLIW